MKNVLSLFVLLLSLTTPASAADSNLNSMRFKKVENVMRIVRPGNTGTGSHDFLRTYVEIVFYGYTDDSGGTFTIALHSNSKTNEGLKEALNNCEKKLMIMTNEPEKFAISISGIKGQSASITWMLDQNLYSDPNEAFVCNLIRKDATSGV